jgi:glc operon protein GlcG
MASPPASHVTALALAGTLLACGTALAQLDKFVITGPAAERIEEKNEISLDTAKQIAAHCEAAARAKGAAASIAILDQFGEQVYFERMDGLRGHRQLDAAIMKAHAVIVTHTPSHEELNRTITGDQSEFHSGFYHDIFLASGGLPIVVDHQFLGAIGVGGSGFDEVCARDALQAVIGPQPPLTPTIPRRQGG